MLKPLGDAHGSRAKKQNFPEDLTRWGNIRVIVGLHGNNGKGHGNDYNGLCKDLALWRIDPKALAEQETNTCSTNTCKP